MKSKSIFQEKIFSDVGQANSLIGKWKREGQQIVFTNGCFDILHKGHVSYLYQASLLGSKLVLGLNSDASVQRQGKSPNRPLQDENSRAHVLAALAFVDAVIIFNEDTPIELISAIEPDVLVKGADYQIKDIVGAQEVLEMGGEVKTIKLEAGYSTSAIEQKILESKN